MRSKKGRETVLRFSRLPSVGSQATPAGSPEAFAVSDGFIPGCRRDGQTITPDWTPLSEIIHDVQIREVRNVPKGQGFLTEIFRCDWNVDDRPVDQIFQVWLGPGEISAWHAHQLTRDRLLIMSGIMKIVLYDARKRSSTFGRVNELRFGTPRPALVTIPPGVWHGLQNLSSLPSGLLNIVDRAYRYKDPDHWRLPWSTTKIPYRFDAAGRRR